MLGRQVDAVVLEDPLAALLLRDRRVGGEDALVVAGPGRPALVRARRQLPQVDGLEERVDRPVEKRKRLALVPPVADGLPDAERDVREVRTEAEVLQPVRPRVGEAARDGDGLHVAQDVPGDARLDRVLPPEGLEATEPDGSSMTAPE